MRYFTFALLALIALITVGCGGGGETGTYFKVDKSSSGPYSVSIFDSRWSVDHTGPSAFDTGPSVWNEITSRDTDNGFIKLKGTSSVKVGNLTVPAYLTYKIENGILILKRDGKEIKYQKHQD
jgi:hypothetical protein